MNQILFAGFCTLLVFVIACTQPPPRRGAGEVETSATTQVNFRVETLVGNVEVPWSIVWAPDGRMVFTERSAARKIWPHFGKLPKVLTAISIFPHPTATDVDHRPLMTNGIIRLVPIK